MKYAVIGAGWAGSSAAVELVKRGHEVHLFEASRTLGGRARQVNGLGLLVDNGQHILLGAYKGTLTLLDSLGVDQKKVFSRLPLQICYADTVAGIELIAWKLPAPMHILGALLLAKGLSTADKMALARFSSSAQWMGWQLNTDCSVDELLQRFDQTDNAIRSIWRPLCLAALNTPAQRASAQVFLNVLKDSLAANRAASDMLIPRTDLTALLPQAAAAFIEDNNGKVYLGCNVSSLYKNDTQWRLEVQQSIRPSYEAFDGVVIATQPDIAKKLLMSVDLAELIPEFEYESITTCYLKYSSTVKLPRPFLTLNERPADAAWGQYVFDRGQTNQQAGLLAVVVSASQVAIEQGRSELALNCAKQLARELGQAELALPKSNLIITEKHATFSCTPGLKRPSNHLPIPGLVLAGDYTDSRYPATLESAVQSGLIAATALSDLDRRLRE